MAACRGTPRGPGTRALTPSAPNVTLLQPPRVWKHPLAALSPHFFSSLPASSLVLLSLPTPSHQLIPSSAPPSASLTPVPLLLCRCPPPPLTSSGERQRLSAQIAAVQRVRTATGLFARVLPCAAWVHMPLFTRAFASPRGRICSADRMM